MKIFLHSKTSSHRHLIVKKRRIALTSSTIKMKFPAISFAFSALTSLVLADADSLLINTTSGVVRGFSPHKSIHSFLGIPYALAPVGDRRFAPPQPLPEPLTGEIEATQFGPSCFQISYKSDIADRNTITVGESEDCLSLNVWVPADRSTAEEERLPVLVFLQGGGFVTGSSNIPLYNPVEIVKEHQDIIVVTFK
jgi:carboxylesterase type B